MALSVNSVGNGTQKLVSFKSNEKKENYVSTNKQSDDKCMRTATKVMIGATALAATAAIYIATRGKVKAQAPEGVKTMQILDGKISHLDMDLFKKYGHFEKGKAVLNGKPYYGKIYTNNGCELTYSNGLLEQAKTPKATKYYYKGKLHTIDHKYHYVGQVKKTSVDILDDGTKVITQRRGGYDNQFLDNPDFVPTDKNHDIITTIKPDGTITRLTKNLEERDKLGNIFVYDKLQDLKTGKVSLTKKEVKPNEYFGFPHRDIKRRVVVDGKKVTQELNSKGEVTSSWTTEFNPKTGVSTQRIEYPTRPEATKIETIMRDKNGNVLENCGDYYRLYNTKDSSIGKHSNMGKCSSANPYSSIYGKDKMQEIIQKEGLPFEV